MVCNTMIPCITPLIFWWMVLFIVACHHPLSCCISIFVWFLHISLLLLLYMYMYIAILCIHTGLLTYTSYDAYADVLHWCSCRTCPNILCKWYMVLTCSTCSSAGRGGSIYEVRQFTCGTGKRTYIWYKISPDVPNKVGSLSGQLTNWDTSLHVEPLRSCNHNALPTSCVLILIIGAILFQSVLILIVGVSALINWLGPNLIHYAFFRVWRNPRNELPVAFRCALIANCMSFEHFCRSYLTLCHANSP